MTIINISKTFTATKIVYGQISLWLDASENLNYKRDYAFVDAEGNHIPYLQTKNIIEGFMPWVDVPLNIQEALTEIDAYITSQIILQEGL